MANSNVGSGARLGDRRTLPFFQVVKHDLRALTEACDPGQLCTTRSVYFALIEIANDQRVDRGGGEMRLTRQQVADVAGVSVRTVAQAWVILRSAGLLEVQSGKADGMPNTVALTSAEGRQSLPTPSAAIAQGVGSHCTPLKETGVQEETKKEEGVATQPVEVVFAAWQERCGHPQAKLDAKRRRAVVARLKDGYTVADLLKAIEGAARAPFVNDAGKRFDDLELICRNGPKVEDFIARADQAPRADRWGMAPDAEWQAQAQAFMAARAEQEARGEAPWQIAAAQSNGHAA